MFLTLGFGPSAGVVNCMLPMDEDPAIKMESMDLLAMDGLLGAPASFVLLNLTVNATNHRRTDSRTLTRWTCLVLSSTLMDFQMD